MYFLFSLKSGMKKKERREYVIISSVLQYAPQAGQDINSRKSVISSSGVQVTIKNISYSFSSINGMPYIQAYSLAKLSFFPYILTKRQFWKSSGFISVISGGICTSLNS